MKFSVNKRELTFEKGRIFRVVLNLLFFVLPGVKDVGVLKLRYDPEFQKHKPEN